MQPTWWDGADRQQAMIEMIKADIKRHAESKRERKAAARMKMTVDDFSAYNGDDKFIVQLMQDFLPKKTSFAPRQQLPGDYVPAQGTTPLLRFPGEDEDEQVFGQLSMLTRGRDFDADFLMKYLDYVFPLLFPFYQPGLHETGRSWILVLLRKSRVAFHSAMSISAFFFTCTLMDGFPGQHQDCKSQLWEKVNSQTERCFEMIQRDIRNLGVRGGNATLSDTMRVMESIIQFMIFEVTLGRSANWNMHLKPAIALFGDIWQSTITGKEGSESKLLVVLDAITPHLRFGGSDARSGAYIWTPEQAGFRFFAGLLVFIDIVASTALEQPPRLAKYHPYLLADVDNGESDFGTVPIRLSRLVGCQNWVLVVISRISVLAAWKKEMKKGGNLPSAELIDRGADILQTLDEGFARLESLKQPSASSDRSHMDVDSSSLQSRSIGGGFLLTSSRPSFSITATKIWALAAQIYLTVVVSGRHTSDDGIRSGVAEILSLVDTQVDPSIHLRTLAWPICVAGCVADAGSGHEQDFRKLFSRVDELTMVGALGESRKVMEKVWENRDTADREDWDLATCFQVLGAPALMV